MYCKTPLPFLWMLDLILYFSSWIKGNKHSSLPTALMFWLSTQISSLHPPHPTLIHFSSQQLRIQMQVFRKFLQQLTSLNLPFQH